MTQVQIRKCKFTARQKHAHQINSLTEIVSDERHLIKNNRRFTAEHTAELGSTSISPCCIRHDIYQLYRMKSGKIQFELLRLCE